MSAFDVDKLIRNLFAAGPVEHEFSVSLLVDLFQRTKVSLSEQQSLLILSGPLYICGDINGQYADLLAIFEKGGWPFNSRYLFLGDYVDRGKNSLEVLVLLSALQLRFPQNVHLLRGNHEFLTVNKNYGFLSELRARYLNRQECDLLFELIGQFYCQLPIAALVCDTILCIHGGLSPSLNSIQQLKGLKRGQMEPTDLLKDLLWADSSPSCKGYQPNDNRGYTLDYQAISEQCSKLGVSMIICGHQEKGAQFSNKQRVFTLFSAPSYSDDFHNRAGVLKISSRKEVTFIYLQARKMRTIGKTVTVIRSSY